MIIDRPTKDQLPELCSLWCEAFGDTEEFFGIFQRTAYSEERCRCLTLDGSVAAALYWFDCECDGQRIAYLYAIATRAEHRGKGLCRALMENTHAQLRALGYTAALLVPSEPSLFGFYEKMGYKASSGIGELICRVADKKAVLTPIGKSEYATLRRAYLPEFSVIQENENLDFLAEQSSLYRGDGFLLASRIQDGKVFGLELLGDTRKASEIVAALGCAEGYFRTVGNDRPFAMIFALSEKCPHTTHFGFAFD